MKVNVRIGERTFEVEVGDVRQRPVVATVDGERFEVWPEADTGTVAPVGPGPGAGRAPLTPAAPAAGVTAPRTATAATDRRALRAPIPGIVVSVAVTAGTSITRGQVVCVIEAMKMKNPIRAPRDGRVAAVRVGPGQTVRHDDVLMEFDE